MENVTFPYKATLPKSNVKTNRMESSKWTYNKEQSFATHYVNILKILF